MPSIKTVGELRKFLETIPDDVAVGGYDGHDHLDYRMVDFYVVDRSLEPEWEEYQHQEDLEIWWSAWGKVPSIVLVCSTD
jgi:hypothetical protein